MEKVEPTPISVTNYVTVSVWCLGKLHAVAASRSEGRNALLGLVTTQTPKRMDNAVVHEAWRLPLVCQSIHNADRKYELHHRVGGAMVDHVCERHG